MALNGTGRSGTRLGTPWHGSNADHFPNDADPPLPERRGRWIGALRRPLLHVYVLALSGVLTTIFLTSWHDAPHLDRNVGTWIALMVLFGIVEYGVLFLNAASGRQSMGSGEAVLLPMLALLSVPQVVLGVTLAMIGARAPYWREGWVRNIFNVAQYGLAAGLSSLVWHSLAAPVTGAFPAMNAVAGIAAVAVFALVTHLMVAVAIWLATGDRLRELATAFSSFKIWNLIGNIMIGLTFAAAYAGAEWTLGLFPVALGALYLGQEAVARQVTERERVENLHAASSALAASRDLAGALDGFLRSVAEVVSAREARVILVSEEDDVMSGVREGRLIYDLAPAGDLAIPLLHRFENEPSGIVMPTDSPGEDMLRSFGAKNLVAVPVMQDGRTVACLVALDRVGAGEFGDVERRLLEALAADLTLTLESYRLFGEVTEERERFARIFEGSMEGICLLDEAGVVVAWNPALESITGYRQDELLGRVWSDVLTLRYSTQKRVGATELVRVDPEVELELVTREGPTRWISVMAGGVAAGDKDAYVVLVRDRSAEREAEEAKSDFLATISHELRTPLTTIKGALQMLSRTGPDLPPSTQQQMFALMKRGSDRLERLVMNLLFVSQIESSGVVQMFSDEFSLEGVVRERIESVLSDHADVYVDVEGGEIEVRADRERLGLAIEHILDNARKFAGDGRITVHVGRSNGYAAVSVTDHGPGIAQVDQDRIFERFTRLGQVLTRETQGAGVGLFIAKRSIEAMGGGIKVESEPGAGATFHVMVPLARPMIVADGAGA